MCGIAGIIGAKLRDAELEQRLLAMQRALHHRGPDDQGLFISPDGAAGLVNTRLAILDLSPAGHQPMTSRDGRFTIAFNGEIYNYGALRTELSVNGYSLSSYSDTEVVLALFQELGPACVKRLEGMFAIAIWDKQERSLFLARDPLGIKPLYYSAIDGSLCFASEMRALLASELVPHEVSAPGLRGYLLSGSVQEPDTLLKDAFMLPAGHHLTWRDGKATVTKYWDVQFGGQSSEVKGPWSEVGGQSCVVDDYSSAVRVVRAALDESIDRHLVSDVPVGIFLSGGIDSTAIGALAAQKVKEPLRTFSISFDDPAFDEGDVAARTAAHFGTMHSDWRLDAATAKPLLEEFLARSDQPSIDGFNTFCVSKMAHNHGLKVVLSGLGGDELFGGYQSFTRVPQLLRASQRLGFIAPLRKVAGRALEMASDPRTRRIGSFLRGRAGVEAAYQCMRGIFTAREAESLLPLFDVSDRHTSVTGGETIPAQPTVQDKVSYLELTRYMRNQLLRDSDVMSMAWSLELRVPLVDRKLIDTISVIPSHWRLAPGKKILLDAVPEIPEWVRNRPKQGFTFPFQDWVTTEWRDTFERIEERSPVPLQNWYRTWCLFALEKWIE